MLPEGTVQHVVQALPESEIMMNEEHLKRVDGVLYTVNELSEVVHAEIQANRFPLIVGAIIAWRLVRLQDLQNQALTESFG
jgi:arginase